jgi:hypothetical protein
VLTLLLNIFIFVKITAYKFKNLSKDVFHPRSKFSWLIHLEHKMVSDLTTNIITAICLLLIGVSQLQFNFSNLSDMNRYPHYLYEYFYRLIRVPLMFHLLVLVSYVRNGELRKTIFREFQAWWGEFFSGKNTFYCDV